MTKRVKWKHQKLKKKRKNKSKKYKCKRRCKKSSMSDCVSDSGSLNKGIVEDLADVSTKRTISDYSRGSFTNKIKPRASSMGDMQYKQLMDMLFRTPRNKRKTKNDSSQCSKPQKQVKDKCNKEEHQKILNILNKKS
jgi:hypothetical protein